MPFFLLRLEVLWGQGPSFLLPLDPVGMGRILHGRTNSVLCSSFLVLFLPSFIAVLLWNLNDVLTCILQPFPGKMDYIPSHSVLSAPPGWQRGIKGELWSFLEGSIIANFFFFLYRYCFYIIAPSAPEQMFYWVLLAMILFWKFWDIIERGEG